VVATPVGVRGLPVGVVRVGVELGVVMVVVAPHRLHALGIHREPAAEMQRVGPVPGVRVRTACAARVVVAGARIGAQVPLAGPPKAQGKCGGATVPNQHPGVQ
jgi:hypothetical protein